MFDDNKRKFPRADYPCSLTVWRQDGDQGVVLAHTANIGAGGLCVHLNQALAPGLALDIRIDFPSHSTPFKCKGKVVRCEESPDGKGQLFYAVGVEFESMDEVKQAYLQGVVSDLIALHAKTQKKT